MGQPGMVRSTTRRSRWLRYASMILPVIAVGVVIFSLIASTGGEAPVSARSDRSHPLASLLNGAGAQGKPRLTEKHLPAMKSRPVPRAKHQHAHRGGGLA